MAEPTASGMAYTLRMRAKSMPSAMSGLNKAKIEPADGQRVTGYENGASAGAPLFTMGGEQVHVWDWSVFECV